MGRTTFCKVPLRRSQRERLDGAKIPLFAFFSIRSRLPSKKRSSIAKDGDGMLRIFLVFNVMLSCLSCVGFDTEGPYRGVVVETNKMARPHWVKVDQKMAKWPDGLYTYKTVAKYPLKPALEHAVAQAKGAILSQKGYASREEVNVMDIYYEAINRLDSETNIQGELYEIYVLLK